ncbi:942_t:CDS:10 [Diversispora eburnea]|uniref:Actin cytoskeleton-regulatory complex protein SLA1 n=1 Tax=Diversispora eburnea TaxID=1213867 RepID=A0A9N9BCK3_9GLOM|nr:942_t:CDS:10 [Diversispora eburnea]
MPLNYKSICIALYDYSAQNDDEISFKEDDVLYILENDDDEWWKAKLKIKEGEGEAEGPIGVVPSNYIQEAECSTVLKAIYDYVAESDEGLSFSEDDIFYLYDKDDQDWYLVKHNDTFGYVPASYVEENKQRRSLFDAVSSATEQNYVNPLELYAHKVSRQKIGGGSSALKIQTWSVVENINGKKKKKKKGTLSVGGDIVVYASESDKAPVQQWNISDLVDIKHEKKRVIISFGGAKAANFDFQANNKNEAEAIYNKVHESMKLPTVNLELSSPTRSTETDEVDEVELSSPKFCVAMYDFDAQGDDELTVREGDELWIIDDLSSRDWWKVRKGNKEGVVPSAYIEIREDNVVYDDDDNKESERKRREAEKKRLLAEEKRKQAELQEQNPPALPSRPPVRSRPSFENEAVKKIQTPTNRALPDRPAQAQSKSKPIPSKTRTWTDRTGAFKSEAQFIKYEDGKVHLHKLNGVKISVPVERMCKADLLYLEEVTGEKFDDRTDDIPLAAIAAAHRGKETLTNSRRADYDWFDFFLKADVAHEDAFEYAQAFLLEKMDESSIPDLNRKLMKGLGVREGDIIRINKYITENCVPSRRKNVSFGATSIIPDENSGEKRDQAYTKKVQNEEYEKSQPLSEFDRKMQEKRDEQLARELQEEENRIARSEGRKVPKSADIYGNLDSIIQKEDKNISQKPAPLLFSENNGVLKNNTKKTRPQPSKTAPIQIDASSFAPSKEKIDAAFTPSTPLSENDKFEDNAWKTTTPVKPASSMANSNTASKFNWGSSTPVSSAVSPVQSQMVPQSSMIHTQAPPPPPPLAPPIVVPLNATLQPPLIPAKSVKTSQFNTPNPSQSSNLLMNNFSGPNSTFLSTSPNNWNNTGISSNSINSIPTYNKSPEINQFNLNRPTSSFNSPSPQQTVQQSSQSSIYDPQNVFASMRAGQIGPKIPPSNLTDVNNDKYSAFKQVDPHASSVFTNSIPTNQIGGFNTPTWNQTGINTFNPGVPQNNLGFPNPGFGLVGAPPQQIRPNQQGFNPTGFNNNPPYNQYNQGGFSSGYNGRQH